jgi:hypothetical protein
MYTLYAVWSCIFGICSTKGELCLKGTGAIVGIAKLMVMYEHLNILDNIKVRTLE